MLFRSYGGVVKPEREEAPAPVSAPVAPSAPPEESPAPAAPSAPSAEAAPFSIIGEAFSTYVLVERGEELLVIDKHAAHERILFEELLSEQRSAGKSASQGLLFPLSLSLAALERAAAAEYREDILSVGFSYTETADGVEIDAIPAAVSPEAAEDLFAEMLGALSEGAGHPVTADLSRRERALWQVACKAAIKGGRHYDEAHVRWLCERVLARPDITVCPHGRPIAFTMTKHRLDREFNRIQH